MTTEVQPKLGQRVQITGKDLIGRIAYVGRTSFSSGQWVGIVLDEPRGKNNGTVRGSSYFKCAPNRGLFVRPTQLLTISELPTTTTTATTTPPPPSLNNDNKKEENFELKMEKKAKKSINAQLVDCQQQQQQQLTAITTTSTTNTTSTTSTTEMVAEEASTVASATPLPSGPTLLPVMTCTQRRSTSYTQLRPTRISQPKPTTATAQSTVAQLTLAMPVPLALAPKRSKTSVSPTSCMKRSDAFVEKGFLEILRPQFTPGPSQRTTNTVAAVPALTSQLNNVEQSGVGAELRQLKEELQLLRTQRSDDKIKLLELERIRIHNEQLVEFKSQIMAQQVHLTRDLQRSRHDLREAHDMVAKYRRELDEVADSIELLTLDKEMAEERVETLQLELEVVQERNDELCLDVEILRAEQEGQLPDFHRAQDKMEKNGKTTTPTSVPVQTVGELLRLEQYNQRLRETVVRLRDTLAEEKQQGQRTHKELETKHSEINELKSIKELLSQRVEQMEGQLIDLKEQVDATLGAEAIISQLASVKLELEERVKLLEDEVNELEALEQIQEQLIESNQELETDLRDEIDKLSDQIKELEKEKNAVIESLYDRDVTILKFRELVKQLQEQQQQQLQQQHHLKTDGTTALLSIDDFSGSANDSQQGEEHSHSQTTDYQQMFSVSKAYGRALEQQLKTVESRIQRRHLEYVLAFVPEQFMLRGGEHDVMLVMLLLDRMNDKLNIVCQAINEKFPTACEFGRDAIYEGYSVQRFIFRSKCIYMLKSLQLELQQFRFGLDHCDYETSTHAAIYRADLEAQEQQLDEFVRLLKTGQLDEHTNCEPMQRVLHYINGLHQSLMSPQSSLELFDEHSLYVTLLEIYEAGLDSVNANAGLLHTIIQLGDEQTTSFQCMQFLMEQSCGLKQKLKKLQRKLSSTKAAWTGMQITRYQRILEANEALSVLINILGLTAHEASKESNGIAHEKLWRLFAVNYSKFHTESGGGGELDGFSQQCMKLLDDQMDELSTLMKSSDINTEYVRHATTNTLMQRAVEVKRHYDDVKALELTVTEREKEIKSLKYMAKLKQQDYSELQIRKEMGEKQLKKLTTDHCQVLTQMAEALEQLEQTMATNEAAICTAVERLSNKLETLEEAQLHWQQQQQLDNACVTTTTLSSNRDQHMLQQALRMERELRVQIQGTELRRSFAALEPLHIPQRVANGYNQGLDNDLLSLKDAWLKAHMDLSPGAAQKRADVELRANHLLRHIFQAYCVRNPHRAVPTDFALFMTEDFRRAI